MDKNDVGSRYDKNASDLSASTRAPLVDKILRLERRVRALEADLLSVLAGNYCAEFAVVDGLSQHPLGLTFAEWLVNEGWEQGLQSTKRRV